MTAIDRTALEPLEPHCEWRREDLADGYVFRLTDAHVDELDEALVHAESVAGDVLDITRDDFPLPTLGPDLIRLAEDLINGRGVVLIRGLPLAATTRNAHRRSTGALARTSAHHGRRTPRGTCWET